MKNIEFNIKLYRALLDSIQKSFTSLFCCQILQNDRNTSTNMNEYFKNTKSIEFHIWYQIKHQILEESRAYIGLGFECKHNGVTLDLVYNNNVSSTPNTLQNERFIFETHWFFNKSRLFPAPHMFISLFKYKSDVFTS